MPKILNDVKKSLLEEMERLLQQDGYGAVTIRAVAAGCGLAVGTVYNYFPSKEAMLAEYLLEDWRGCIAAITQAGSDAKTPEPVARCIYDQLISFCRSHEAIFRSEAARSAFSGSFSQYHGLLRSQLAAPLRPFCSSDFAAEFLAEALLTWTMAGTPFCTLWDMIRPLFHSEITQ